MNLNQADKVQEVYFNGALHTILVVNGNEKTYIPLNSDNTDYQAYLRWCEEGNTPLPADEVQA